MSKIKYLAYMDLIAHRPIKVIEGSDQHKFVSCSADYQRRADLDEEKDYYIQEED